LVYIFVKEIEVIQLQREKRAFLQGIIKR